MTTPPFMINWLDKKTLDGVEELVKGHTHIAGQLALDLVEHARYALEVHAAEQTPDRTRAEGELDARIASEVVGWKYSVAGNWPWQMVPPGEDGKYVRNCPRYSTDAGADCQVLELVRKTWPNRKQVMWVRALQDGYMRRCSLRPIAEVHACEELMYEPGDYSRAALEALKQ